MAMGARAQKRPFCFRKCPFNSMNRILEVSYPLKFAMFSAALYLCGIISPTVPRFAKFATFWNLLGLAIAG